MTNQEHPITPQETMTPVDVIRAVADLPSEPEIPFNVVDVVRAVADLPIEAQ